MNGEDYKTAEHYYQCGKAIHLDQHHVVYHINLKEQGHEAKGVANSFLKGQALKNLKKIPGFSEALLQWQTHDSIQTVRHILRNKFEQSQSFRAALMRTGNKFLLHNVTCTNWGTGSNDLDPIGENGNNIFGQELMNLREQCWYSSHAQTHERTSAGK